jgi:hypothetical protein
MKMSELNLYYVGSTDIATMFTKGQNHSWTGSLEEMTKKAVARVETGAEKVAVIVKIVRVIRRATPPIIVEDVSESDRIPPEVLKDKSETFDPFVKW